MNPSPKDESTIHEVIGKGREKADQATNEPALAAEGKAEDLALSNSLFLASRYELLKTEAELKRETEEETDRRKEF